MKRAAYVLIGLLVTAAPSVARAQDESLDAAAEARFKEGVNYAKQGKYEQARGSFLQTLALSPGSPKVLLNLAISEHGAGHPVEALGHLKTYLANPKVDAKKAQDIRQSLYEDLWKVTGHLRIQADRGDALILDGDVKLGNAPLVDVVDVSMGKHRVASGAHSIDVTVSAGETKEVVLSAEPAPPSSSPAAASNTHTEELPPEPRHSSSARWIVPVGLGVAAAGALALGVGFAAGNRSAVKRADDAQTANGGSACADQASAACGERRDALSTASTDQTWSYVGFIGAGVLAAGAVASIIFWPHDSRRTARTRVLPGFGATAGSVQLQADF